MAEPQLLLNYTGHLPECPTWSAEENALYWADILEGEIHRYHLPTGEHTVLSFHEEVGCFALRERGGFIVAMVPTTRGASMRARSGGREITTVPC